MGRSARPESLEGRVFRRNLTVTRHSGPGAGSRTRPGGYRELAYAIMVEAPHFVMERRMLLGIKARAERPRPSAKSLTRIRVLRPYRHTADPPTLQPCRSTKD